MLCETTRQPPPSWRSLDAYMISSSFVLDYSIAATQWLETAASHPGRTNLVQRLRLSQIGHYEGVLDKRPPSIVPPSHGFSRRL